MPPLDGTDRAILNRIQSDFPRDQRPYGVIARELGLQEDEVLQRISRLKAEGVIRRVGGNFYPEKLGFVSTLCAARVPDQEVEAFARAVNRHAGVTHNYERDNAYNVWFTFIAESREEIAAALESIRRETGIGEILNLPATRVFKIRARFSV
jgi:DNA-binding Lrp family transcriptional regulator